MKKNITLLAAGIVGAAVLTACGNEAATNNATNNATTASTEAATEASTQAETDAASSGLSTLDVSTLETINLNEINAADIVTLGEYKGITVEVVPAKDITDEDVETELAEVYAEDPLREEEPVTEGVIELGDIANIDFVGKHADTMEAFEGGTGAGYDLTIGSHQFIDGFEDGLIGVNIGDTVDLNLTFPEDYQAAELAGKDVVFTVTVNSAKKVIKEPTDAWVESRGLEDVTTLDEFREHLRTELEEQESNRVTNDVKNSIMDTIIANATFEELPEKLYNRYLSQQYQQWSMQATYVYYQTQQMFTPEQIAEVIMQQSGLTGSVDDYISDVVTTNARDFVILQAIADVEGLRVSDEELEEALQGEYDVSTAAANMTFEEYKENSDVEYYRDTMMGNRVLDFLMENANIVEIEE